MLYRGKDEERIRDWQKVVTNGEALADGTSESWSTVGNGGDVGERFVEPKIVLGSTDGNASYIYTKY